MHIIHISDLDAEDFQGLPQLRDKLSQIKDRPSIITSSVLGSAGLTLEAVTEAYTAGKKEVALDTFQSLFDWHVDLLRDLSEEDKHSSVAHLDEFRTEVEWLLHDKPVRPFDYYYDQIVCVGALMSSVIEAAVLRGLGFNVQWTDARDIIRTDDIFRNGTIDEAFTARQIDRLIKPALDTFDFIVIQGGIGATDENESTTLGSNGIHNTMSVLSKCLDTAIISI